MSAPTERPAARPIAVPASTNRPDPPPREDIAAAQSTDIEPAAAEDTAASGVDPDEHADHSGERFALDLGGSLAPVVLFSVLTALAVLLGVVADPLPVRIVTGVIAVGAGALTLRAAARRTG